MNERIVITRIKKKKMIVSRKKAIQVILSATDVDGWDAWMESHNLYDSDNDKIPSIDDILNAIGVSSDEVKEAQELV